ncbi:MAG: sulfatase-like hydrolase/transferase [Pseudomonadales bacterium]
MSFAAWAKPGSRIVYDAEYLKLEQQHGVEWATENAAIAQKLEALRVKHGKRPNVIHIMWDDHSLGEVGNPLMNKVYGYDTPNINQMAREGVSFARMYTEPSCTPTRAAVLTGRLAVRSGMYKVGFPADGIGLHKDEVTIAEVLSRAGYQTAFVGKGHQGDIEQAYLHNQGFDYANFSIYNQYPFIMWHKQMAVGGAVQGLFPEQFDKRYALDSAFRPLGFVNQLEGRKGEQARVYTGNSLPDYKRLLRDNQRQVVEYIKEHADDEKPMYLAYWPHVYDAARKPSELTTSASTWFAQSVVELDRDIGEILRTIKDSDIAENTLVIAMADNGPMHELAPMGPHEGILRGGKGDYLEGGIRVPAFAWWPGVVAENTVIGDIVTAHDLFTTFARLGDAMDRVPRDRVIDGVDQSALLFTGDGHSRRDYYHVYTGNLLAATIKQQFKRVWVGDRPGLVGDSFHDLYKDTREEHADMAPYLWAWAAFDQMKARHEKLMARFPNRQPTRGVPYEGIADLPEAAKQLSRDVSATH